MNKETVTNIVALAIGGGVGFGTAYILQKRKYEKWFAEDMDKRDQDTRDRLNKEGAYASPEDAVRELIGEQVIAERPLSREEVNAVLILNGQAPLNGEDTYDVKAILEETGIQLDNPQLTDSDDELQARESIALSRREFDYNSIVPSEPEDTLEGFDDLEVQDLVGVAPTGEDIVNSIWANSARQEQVPVSATENEDAEVMPARHPDKPYIITVDQFMTETLHDDNKQSLVFFEGDGTLCDERESILTNVEELVGQANLHHFGLGSRDRNAVYVRNEKLKMDIEVVRDDRSFQEAVLGIKPKEERVAPLRMRENDQ